MDPIETKLAAWTELYGQLKAARAKLKEAKGRPGPVAPGLQADVETLERKCYAALDDLNAEYAKRKKPP
jgi:hypothetical protein